MKSDVKLSNEPIIGGCSLFEYTALFWIIRRRLLFVRVCLNVPCSFYSPKLYYPNYFFTSYHFFFHVTIFDAVVFVAFHSQYVCQNTQIPIRAKYKKKREKDKTYHNISMSDIFKQLLRFILRLRLSMPMPE